MTTAVLFVLVVAAVAAVADVAVVDKMMAVAGNPQSENWDDMHDTGTAAAVAGRIQTAVDDTPGRVQWLTDVAAVVWGRDVKL